MRHSNLTTTFTCNDTHAYRLFLVSGETKKFAFSICIENARNLVEFHLIILDQDLPSVGDIVISKIT